ncbi:hypothetical protein P691DRAFT_805962, partial [Macrolepiota fuliginosa MF-IS2]
MPHGKAFTFLGVGRTKCCVGEIRSIVCGVFPHTPPGSNFDRAIQDLILNTLCPQLCTQIY